MDKRLKKFFYFLGYSIFLFALVLLITFYWSSRKTEHITDNCDDIKYYQYYTVEKNGVSFEKRTLSINAMDKKNESQKINFISITKIRVIEIIRETRRFTIKTYCNNSLRPIEQYFFCPDKQTWNEFMKFIKEETSPIGVGFTQGSVLYLF